ncbi:MAG: 2-C-methyl-D-erythritol 2,4-cyclodiphosphate synthase [Desulfobacterales bacterium]|nr:2-C-methyl-D-erythritol 2,4-cyclodiphosphate synthase [Desulfobacterales bacterium]
MKIGFGVDVHAFAPDRDLILGGVNIEYHMGLKGHSDADVLIHSVCDAILGAAGLGDIGDHFPDTDDQYKGISSRILLEESAQLLAKEGYEIVNVDCVIFAQAPKLGPHKREMGRIMASILGLSADQVNVKATTTERLGFIGKKEGIAAQTTLLVTRIPGNET